MTPPFLHELQQHAAALRRLARDLVGANAADDVLQDAAVEVLRAPPPVADNVFAWLRVVVRHLAGKHRRAAAVRRKHEQAAAVARGEAAFTAAGAESADTMRWLSERIAVLPEPYRSTLLARYLRDEAPAAIAAATGVPVRTVKTRLQRGLALLRADCDERGGDWRGALVVAFALPVGEATATAMATTITNASGTTTVSTTATATVASSTAALTLGILGMSTTTKTTIAAAVLLAIGFTTWHLLQPAPAAATNVAAQVVPAAASATPLAPPPVVPPPLVAAAPAPARTDAAPPAPALPRATADQIVVHVVDAATGAPIEAFGLREHMAAGLAMGEKERPLIHGEPHPGGRALVPAARFAGHQFVVEEAAGRYLPSVWFGASDAKEVDGERTISLRLPPPRDVTVRVVRERTGEPIVGARVELLRPYPASPDVTLRTIALPTTRFRVQPDVNPMMVAFAGGWALQLASEVSDADGRVRFRAIADEALALRLLGPGHTPVVRQPWRVGAETPGEVVEVVGVGGVIEVHLRPLSAWAQLREELPREASLWPGGDGCGVRLNHVETGTQRPAGVTAAPYAPDERGVVRIDGLAAGTWAATFRYYFRNSDPLDDTRPGSTGSAEITLPIVTNLGDGETRVLQLDLGGLGCGKLDATVTLAGQLVGEGHVFVQCVAGSGGRTLQVGGQGLQFGRDAHCIAQLPPGRYFASLHGSAKGQIPLGEFPITTATTTRIDLIPDLVPLTVRVLQPDGAAAAGTLWLQRPGWFANGSTNPTGEIVFPNVLRGDRVDAMFRRVTGTTPQGTPAFGPPVQLGTVHAAADGAVLKLRLPPQ